VDEYGLYRRYRLAVSEDAKLAAAYEYLRRNPTGRWRAPMREWFTNAEAYYLERSWDSVAGLKRFSASVPKGVGAARAARRVVELELWLSFERSSDARFDEAIERMEERLARAEQGRRKLLTTISAWSARLAAFREWGRRTSELGHDFIYAFRLEAPAARCSDGACTKTIVIAYEIPENKRPSPREAVYDVRLVLADGGVAGVALTGPDLFSRLGEAVSLRPIDPTDYAARTEAIARAVDLVSLAVDAALPPAECAVAAVSPVLLHRRCEGVDLRMITATDPSEEDRLVVTPVSASP
jgi:hypothetical protein